MSPWTILVAPGAGRKEHRAPPPARGAETRQVLVPTAQPEPEALLSAAELEVYRWGGNADFLQPSWTGINTGGRASCLGLVFYCDLLVTMQYVIRV